MRNTLITIFCMLVLYYVLQDPKPTHYEEEIYTPYVRPDPNREVHHYDWQTGKFVYKDEVPKEPEPKITEDDWDYFPDYSVSVHGYEDIQNNSRPRYLVIDGKRYRIIYQPNGTQDLIETR